MKYRSLMIWPYVIIDVFKITNMSNNYRVIDNVNDQFILHKFVISFAGKLYNNMIDKLEYSIAITIKNFQKIIHKESGLKRVILSKFLRQNN